MIGRGAIVAFFASFAFIAWKISCMRSTNEAQNAVHANEAQNAALLIANEAQNAALLIANEAHNAALLTANGVLDAALNETSIMGFECWTKNCPGMELTGVLFEGSRTPLFVGADSKSVDVKGEFKGDQDVSEAYACLSGGLGTVESSDPRALEIAPAFVKDVFDSTTVLMSKVTPINYGEVGKMEWPGLDRPLAPGTEIERDVAIQLFQSIDTKSIKAALLASNVKMQVLVYEGDGNEEDCAGQNPHKPLLCLAAECTWASGW